MILLEKITTERYLSSQFLVLGTVQSSDVPVTCSTIGVGECPISKHYLNVEFKKLLI